MIIRPRTSSDIDQCVDIMRRTHEASGYPRFWPEDPTSFLASTSETNAWIAADDTGSIVGHVGLHAADDAALASFVKSRTGSDASAQAYVARLLVDPEAQTGGIGRALLTVATKTAKQHRKTPVLDVLKTAHGAVGFYEAMGWRRIGSFDLRLPDDPDLPLWVYVAPSSQNQSRGTE